MASERKFVTENVKRVLVKEHIMAEVRRAGFGGIEIQRTPMGTRVTLFTERPGMVIGHKGESIKALTELMRKEYGFENPQIEVEHVKEPNLNPQIMAEKLASALERGWHFRRAGHSTVRRIMDAGARGCEVIISGKLTGQRHRVEKFKEGHIKFCGEPKLQWMRKGFAIAKVKLGVIGVVVWIMDPNAKLPDEVSFMPEATEEEKAEEAPQEETEERAGEEEKTPEKDEKEKAPSKEPKEEKVKEKKEQGGSDKNATVESKGDKKDEPRGEKKKTEGTEG